MGAASVTFILLCFTGCLSHGSSSSEEQRIIGGTPTGIENIPSQVSISIGIWFCGGSIISESWVVSAAHCFVRTPARDRVRRTTVCSGSSYRRNCIVHTAADVITHERYNETVASNNDIAVVRVTSPFNFNDGCRPIALPSPDASDPSWGTICGWGNYRKHPNGTAIQEFSEQLLCGQVPQVNCTGIVGITYTMMCYGYLELGDVDQCQGDSGGPLLFNGILYGIISKSDCAQPNILSVYTRVTQFVGWIKLKTGIH